MAEVFLSYSSRDRAAAARVAQALGARGWSVWWDREIVIGEAFDQAIERELMAARCVVVLWSQDAAASEWVKNEAAAAAERGVLVPASLDDSRPPLEFRRRQTAALAGFDGTTPHPGFEALCRGVERVLGGIARGGASPPAPAPAPAPASPLARIVGIRVALAAALVLTVGGLAWVLAPRADESSVLDSRMAPAATRAASAPEPATAATLGGLAALVAGTYDGEIVADSRGPSRSDVRVVVQALARTRVQVQSDNPRIGRLDVELTRTGDRIVNVDGESLFNVDLAAQPPTLALNPRNELAFHGRRLP